MLTRKGTMKRTITDEELLSIFKDNKGKLKKLSKEFILSELLKDELTEIRNAWDKCSDTQKELIMGKIKKEL